MARATPTPEARRRSERQNRQRRESNELMALLQQPKGNVATRRRRRISRPQIAGLAVAALVLVAAAVFAFGLGSQARAGGQAGDSQMAQAVPVRAVAARRGHLSVRTAYSGELVGEVSDISPQVSGLLVEVPARIGQRVAAGTVLAVIADVEVRNQLQEARGQLGVAEANRDRAAAELVGVEADYQRAMELYDQGLLSEQEQQQVTSQYATTKANLAAGEAQVRQSAAREALLAEQFANTRVRAPFDAVVSDRYLDRGALVQPGTPILRLVEEAPLLVQFRVPERDLSAVQTGADFDVATEATGDRTFSGTVRRVAGEVRRNDRTVLVEGELAETDELLLPGMYADVSVSLRDLDNALIVPGTALLERVAMDGARSTGVMVPVDGLAQWRAVTVAGRSGEYSAIAGPIEAGELVLTMGHNQLGHGAPVRVVRNEPQPSDAQPSPTGAAGF
ncbi:MAG: efflux RND transporter periplasmic adaptor subunit [Holophagales bacterium]|nr:efflux RND transporter periplasmic adaptor subunit [Holophagales bacterium]MYF04964.1 efflux RND transporter periplasmic adaptor subunit [Holophagales bacterium]MYJ26412.1 efflux RND transporter periplasmic adaptor subunit [Holophagales bacterium]